MTQDQTKLHTELLSVSTLIAAWAKGQFAIGCSLEEVKGRLLKCAEIAGRK